MKLERCFAVLATLSLASCSANPSAPSAASSSSRRIAGTVEGQAGSAAVITTRLRLRRVGVGDIQTGLVTGQVISVPVNVNLDVWAEIARLETDRARLLVDWGNGNIDHTGCGSCRLENVYKKEGRYTLVVKVIDLSAAPGSDVVTQATVSINVLPAPIAPIACAAIATDFETLAVGTPTPVSVGGATYYTTGGASSIFDYMLAYPPYLMNNTIGSAGLANKLTIEFDSEKTTFGASLIMNGGGTASYQAFSAGGDLVASGPLNFDPVPVGVLGSVFGFSSSAPFRTVVINFGIPGFVFDNVSASCQ